MSSNLGAMRALIGRELLRFVRQPSRIVTSIGVPAIMWLFAGSGLRDSFAMPGEVIKNGVGYGAYVLPGVVCAAIVFGAIFAAMTLIHDRQAGFLQSVLVSPAPRWQVAGAKVIAGTIVTGSQAMVLLLGVWGVGLHPGFGGFVLAIIAAGLTSCAIISMGLALAWWVNSTAGFHGIMSGLLMPMWLLSGALFPVEGASGWLAVLVRINPLHWCQSAIRGSLGMGGGGLLDWVGTILFAGVMFAAALHVLSGKSGTVQSGIGE